MILFFFFDLRQLDKMRDDYICQTNIIPSTCIHYINENKTELKKKNKVTLVGLYAIRIFDKFTFQDI